jgi:hypothetical protein
VHIRTTVDRHGRSFYLQQLTRDVSFHDCVVLQQQFFHHDLPNYVASLDDHLASNDDIANNAT